jgi:hypothetical protein
MSSRFLAGSSARPCYPSGDSETPLAANGGFVSADVTASGFSPSVGPFTSLNRLGSPIGVGSPPPNTELLLNGFLDLFVETPTISSFVGYTGGQLFYPTHVLTTQLWQLTSGSLTEAVAAPEPSSLLLLVSVLAGLGGLLGTRSLLRRTAYSTR